MFKVEVRIVGCHEDQWIVVHYASMAEVEAVRTLARTGLVERKGSCQPVIEIKSVEEE